MPVRPMFKNRALSTSPTKGKRHLHAVNPGNAKSPRKNNPEEQAIPWKTIVATTVVTSVVSTFAVTFARWMLDRARARRELQVLGLSQAQAQQQSPMMTGSRLENPAVGHHMNPLSLPQAPHVNPADMQQTQQAGSQPTLPVVSAYQVPFSPNPFSPQSVQRPLALPQAPHVTTPAIDSREPSWFSDFREDYDRRMQNVEARVRTSEQDR